MTYSATIPPTFSLIAVWMLIGLFLLWPTKRTYVVLKGSDVVERILIFQVPAYYSRHWYVRWRPSDGIFARAYCYNPEKSAEYRAALSRISGH